MHTSMIYISRNFRFAVAVLLGLSSCQGTVATLDPLRLFFTTAPATNSVDADFCTTPATVIEADLKYIFVIDNSTSNRLNYQLKYTTDASGITTAAPACPIVTTPPASSGLTTYATDPTRSRRYQALLDFMTSLENDATKASSMSRFFSLVEFSTTANIRRAGTSVFTQSVLDFKTLVNSRFTATTSTGGSVDNGTTDYLAALNTVKSIIQNDIAAAKTKPAPKASAYVVVFISDGFPIPGAGLYCDNTNTVVYVDQNGNPISPQSPKEIKQLVGSIVALEADTTYVDSITTFTGYISVKGNEDPAAKTLLKEMAEVGNGVGYEFTNGSSVDFSYFTLPSRLLRFELAEVFAENASSVWWPGYTKPLLDSDEDGLPDVVEIAAGLNPLNPDTNGNGVSDLAEYRYPNGASCAGVPAGDDDMDGLSNCDEVYLGNSAGRGNFDTNGNMIPDGLEFRNRLDFKNSAVQAFDDSDLDGISNIQEIKHGTPAGISNSQFLNLPHYQYDLELTRSDQTQSCYHLKVSALDALGPSDLIRIHVVEKSPIIFNQYRLKTGAGRMIGGHASIDLGTH